MIQRLDHKRDLFVRLEIPIAGGHSLTVRLAEGLTLNPTAKYSPIPLASHTKA
jgi:hypothetical protein